jgi:tetratricopeptide (TPR) repeat protein
MLALQARIGVCQEGITATNLQLFRSAIEYFNDRNDPIIPELLGTIEHHRILYALQRPFYMQQLRNLFQGAILQGLVEAALELNQWQDADEISEKCCTFEPESPAAYLLRVRVLVLRAEIQRLCQALQIIKHAPGQEALSEAVCQAFEHAVLNAADRIALNSGAAVQQVTRWRVRGKAVFVPDQDSNAALLAYCDSAANKVILTADDLAALIWSLGYSGQLETAAQWSQRMPNDSLVNTALALSISECDPERAIYLTHQSLERLADPDLNMPHARPMLSALIALVAHRVGARPEEHLLALASIQTALKIWPDEARWHALAADILLSLPVQVLPEVQEQPEAVISVKEHLEHAARLEPDLAEHHLKLGQWHANHGEINLAINETEKATFIEPDQMEPWLELANLQKEAGYLEQAVYSSERALGFTSQPLDALLLRCELAFLTNNPRGTLSRAQAILNLNPKQPKAWFLLAKAHETLEQLVEALSAIEKAISYSDQPQEMQQTRVRLLRSLYGPQTAIQAIQSLLEVYTAEPVLNTLLADYWIELGEPANAIQAARIALQTGQVRLSGKTQAHLHLLIGAQSRTAGQLDQAVYHLNEAIRKDPENIDAFLELGRAHQDRRQNNQALEIYQMAAKIAPHDYRPYYQAGIALKDIKDYLEAETMFRRAARLAPNEVSIHRQLAAVVALNLVHNRRVAAPSAPDRIE